jgi:predicted SprT family Zn-dependent metalloprotease
MNDLQMYQYIEDEVCRCIDLFDKWFGGRTFYPLTRPEVIYAPLTIDAGQSFTAFKADYIFGYITFNSHMIPLNFEKYIEVIVPHETAHWCHAVLHGEMQNDLNLTHGITWKQMMDFFEADSSEHIYDLKSPKIKGLTQYGCNCSVINLDNEDISLYSLDLYCPKCKCDYKLIPKE